ncbi:MAG TPA: molybdopterin-dependent oxidoreductase [Vicinamibacterales bacterium]|nr:molybdopterin-dependent oxidoreductase [Vicinamibacterales bacterium]
MADPSALPIRSWGHSTVHTACPLDCPDSCSLAVTVERGRVIKIDGSHEAPSTDGYICGKVRGFGRRLYGELRVQHPAIRKGPKGGGEFVRVSWDEAFDLIAAEMRRARERFGAESILPYHYGGSNGILTNDLEDARLFRRLGASRLARTLCAAPTGAAATAMYAKMAGVAYSDYEEAQLVVVWGCNPSASGIHLVAHIKKAQKRGARLVVIDPRRTPLARQADLHLAVRPGADLPVALAVAKSMFDHGHADLEFLRDHATGVDEFGRAADAWTIERAAAEAGIAAADLSTFAEWYGTSTPAVIRCGWGQERNRNGGGATMAILALPAIGGKFGVRGGGYTMSNSGAWGITAETLIDVPAPPVRVVNMNHLGRALTEYDSPPIAVLFIYNCNPLATVPDQNRVRKGLERNDLFTVVYEQVMTDTAPYADVLLPATTFLEHYDIAKGYGAYHFHLVQPAVAPVGESRPNHEVFRELGARLGLANGGDDLGETGALMDTAARLPQTLSPAVLEGRVAPAPADGRPVQFVDVRPQTPDGRVQLFPASVQSRVSLYHYEVDPATSTHPLSLISPASEHTISSTLGELRPGVARLKLHPDDAHPRSIGEGDSVRVFNELGEVQCEASVTPEIRPGTVSLPKGLWARSTFNGSTANALVPDTLTDIAGGACFNDARVQVELLARH